MTDNEIELCVPILSYNISNIHYNYEETWDLTVYFADRELSPQIFFSSKLFILFFSF